MKKLTLLFLIAIWVETPAQRQSKDRFKLGFKIGATNHTLTGGRIKSPEKQSLIGGFWCQLKMDKNWSAQAEVIYVEKGTGGYNPNKAQKLGDYAVSIMYLEVPVLFQYHINKFILECGPGLGALTYQYEALYGAPTPNMTDAYPFTTKEFSINVGCGYWFNEKWYLGLRYTHSLQPVRKQIPDISKQVYNRVFALSLSRQLKFKKSAKVLSGE